MKVGEFANAKARAVQLFFRGLYLFDTTLGKTVEPRGFGAVQIHNFERRGVYIKRSVKLEFGSLTDQQPTGRHTIRPWIAEVFPAAFPDWECKVVALEIERTFWEKATILHAEYHRPLDKPIRDRFSRHYADTATLVNHPEAIKAIDHHDLRERVVSWKSLFFGNSSANYTKAKPGTFRVVPRAERLPELRRDYQLMRDMYLNEPVSFDDILSTLSDLEHRINLIPLEKTENVSLIGS